MSRPTDGPSLEIVRNGSCSIVRLVGCKDLHEDNVQRIDRQMANLIEDREGQHLILDLDAVEYLTSTALGKLVALHRRLRQQGGRLSVVNVRAAVWELFHVTRLDRILEVLQSPLNSQRNPDCLSA
jgi:anti-sigma B factor antagonist